MKVIAKNKNYNGRIGVDVFANGVCEQASEEQLSYYRRHGFTVEGQKLAKPGPGAKKAEWEAYARSLGLETSRLTLESIKEAVEELENDERPETTPVSDEAAHTVPAGDVETQ
ncbi:TPA: hypothetical protein ACGIY5_001461 [Corynebacterium striatum]